MAGRASDGPSASLHRLHVSRHQPSTIVSLPLLPSPMHHHTAGKYSVATTIAKTMGTQALLVLLLLLTAIQSASAGLCPVRCRCDDESLRSSCAYGSLDIVPIQLNPEIRHIDLSGNRISGLHMAFEFYENLESLDLSSNLIHTLGSNNFRVQQRLVKLNLSSNAIRTLAKTALHGLAALKHLDLSNNNITDMDEQALRYTSELEHLDLSGNQITSLPAGLLRNLHRIKSLVLSRNSLLESPAANLALTPSLERLDFSDNLIQELGKDSLPSMPGLVHLDLSNNVLRSISDDAFDRVPGLRSLWLAGNNLTSVPSQALSKMIMLTSLLLSRNPLGELRSLAFRNLFDLRQLELNDCSIGRVEARAFADNVNLERISMDGNRELAELPPRVLYAAGNLRWVSLRRCRLSSLQPTQFPVDGLSALRVGGNPLVCNCSAHWLWNVLQTAEERKNESSSSHLEIDSGDIVCADEEFAGKPLIGLPEASLKCRLSALYLCLLVLGCLLATAAVLGLVAYLARLKKRKRVPAYAPSARPELLVYVDRANGQLADKHHESYGRRIIARAEDLVYEAARPDYQQCRRKSGSESSESRETNVYETPRYTRPTRRDTDQTFNSFYQQQQPQRAPPTPPPSNNLHYTNDTLIKATSNGGTALTNTRTCHVPPPTQEGVYAVADVTNLGSEPLASGPELIPALYRMQQRTNNHQPPYGSTRRSNKLQDYGYEPTMPPQKPHVVFV
ncbi:slit homolog 1 protein-like [Copidosoma floridanum]|uniref:slit homolog 1 protein-like n=1 Tax=Copidosoma floridanum TaxID=29053 RepID=UPI0006C9B4AB|nr:slit homolog 1 protein-like [Copidosoma floridanum]